MPRKIGGLLNHEEELPFIDGHKPAVTLRNCRCAPGAGIYQRHFTDDYSWSRNLRGPVTHIDSGITLE